MAKGFICRNCGCDNSPEKQVVIRGDQEPAPVEPKPLTPIQRIMMAYKVAKGIPKEHKEWDRANFGRYSRSAKSLLDCFGGNVERAVGYLLVRGNQFGDRGLEWTLDTIARHAWDNIGKFEEENARQDEQMGADRMLESGGPGQIAHEGNSAGEEGA